MAIYHMHVKNINRKKGPIMKAAAYCCGEALCDQKGKKYNYTHKQEVIHSEIILPSRAPPELRDREMLWNAVDAAEKRKDSRTAREVEIALPTELDHNQQLELVREFVHRNFISRGMCADFSVHDKGNGNPHAHILLTTRSVTEKGFGLKDRSWDDRANIIAWRKSWADLCNRTFIQLGINQHIDHRTLAAQGIDREPTIHLGQKVIAMEHRGRKMERGERCRKIVAHNLEADTAREKKREKKKRRSYRRTR